MSLTCEAAQRQGRPAGRDGLHLMEAMDVQGLPASLHATLREILECGNSRPFRLYYEWVAREVARQVAAGGLRTTVELGAGTAPISRLLATDPEMDDVQLVACDAQPDYATYVDLERQYAERIEAMKKPVDFREVHTWPPDTLLFLSATFHHVPPALRDKVLASLTASGRRVMICEPLRRNLASMLFVFLSIVPAMLLPIRFLGRPGKLRRLFWCWLVPLAPVLFVWDGFVSCLRMWTEGQWHDALRDALRRSGTAGQASNGTGRDVFPDDRPVTVQQSVFCQMVVW